jgi:endonuclease YncB( thermonuclease family)
MIDTGTDWAVERIVSVTDGDTVRLIRRRSFLLDSELSCDVYDRNPRGVAVRLITLDTPERGAGRYLDARTDVVEWLTNPDWPVKFRADLRVETWPGGGFDRLLGDLYVAGDRSNTLSQWMLRERGWQPYVRGK